MGTHEIAGMCLAVTGSALGQCDPSAQFNDVATLAVSSQPGRLVVADFNGDDIEDLVVVQSSNDRLLLYLGDGTAGFGPPCGGACGLGTGDGPVWVHAADLDGDGIVGFSDLLALLSSWTP